MESEKCNYMRCIKLLWVGILIVGFACPLKAMATAELISSPLQYPDLAQEMINLINSLRNQNGLASLNIHPILMQIAQEQADYLAGGGSGGHLDALGRRPFQRALDSGYPVAGDLNLGGFFSENFLVAPLTPQEAIAVWLEDMPHTNTMLSPYRSDIGVGVGWDGVSYYYIVDTGLRSLYPVEWPPKTTTQPGAQATDGLPAVAWVIQDTPLPDGSIIHVVRPGEALWSIAAIYEMTVEQVLELNNMKANAILHPDDRLTIRLAATPTPSPRPTSHPTRTSLPSSTSQPASTSMPSTSTIPSARADTPSTLRTGVWLAAAVVAILLCISLWQGAKEKKTGHLTSLGKTSSKENK